MWQGLGFNIIWHFRARFISLTPGILLYNSLKNKWLRLKSLYFLLEIQHRSLTGLNWHNFEKISGARWLIQPKKIKFLSWKKNYIRFIVILKIFVMFLSDGTIMFVKNLAVMKPKVNKIEKKGNIRRYLKIHFVEKFSQKLFNFFFDILKIKVKMWQSLA